MTQSSAKPADVEGSRDTPTPPLPPPGGLREKIATELIAHGEFSTLGEARNYENALVAADAILSLTLPPLPVGGEKGSDVAESTTRRPSDVCATDVSTPLEGVERALRHHLANLKFKPTGRDPKSDGYAYAEVPDWALRQWLKRVEDARGITLVAISKAEGK